MRRDAGFVLVNALIVVAAVSALSLSILRETTGGISRAAVGNAAQRAEAGLVAGQVLAARLLAEDHAASETDHHGERWHVSGYRTDLEDGATIGLDVEDLQGRFNLNLLLGKNTAAAEALFRGIAEAAGVEPGPAEAILGHYAARRPALGDAPAPLPDGIFFRDEALALPEEIGQIPGVRSAAEALAPLVSTLPEEAGVNVNTAGREVMAAIVGVEDSVAWDAFAARRRSAPFETVGDAIDAIGTAWGDDGAAAVLMQEILDVRSEWFEAGVTSGAAGEIVAARFVLLRREADGVVSVVARVPEDP